ncbi:heme ABC exporter ATP-binding protein CcmA [Sphingomonas sp. PAMC 26621]|uniref:heme ABC exporter ATP-binding protein CcmA n=1 Tax=Sphingomonas sp. PAMC 26621 TaxID=1112213 RepID=UPI000289F070|nr:heme ABC exporter ATP-binding protein CcmA [Sphingomonas sp. PAMC 26621]
MSDHPAAFAFSGVSCVRGGRRLFEALSFALAPGDAGLVSGPNGVGKSSLLRIAAGLLRPAAGTVTHPATRALLAEAHALDPARRLIDALAFWASLDPDTAAARDRALRALADVDLAAIAEVPVRLLSTGQRRRAALARVVASGATLWLLDEPANGLDVASVTMLERLVARHRAAGGIALVATHQPLALPAAQPIDLSC